MIPYGKQDISSADISAVVEVLKSEWLTQGPVVPRFESAVANYCQSEYAVATNSATSALHIACLSLGLKKGDWLWTTANTYVASSNSALYCGAKVDFVDIDPHTYNISLELLQKKLEHADKSGKLPKILIPVHFSGQSCQMEEIYSLSRKYGFKIVEDASHALGGRYKGATIGNCQYSDITVFSFHPVKIITTGEGGMAVTNDANLANFMRQYRTHGITGDRGQMTHRPECEIWNYQQIHLGYNYRMTDIQAALGVSQMHRLDEFVESRNKIAEYYHQNLVLDEIKLPTILPEIYSSYHLYAIRVREGAKKINRNALYNTLKKFGVNVNIHYIPVYRHPYYENIGFKSGYCGEAELFFREEISLPMYPTLSRSDQDFVIEKIFNEIKRLK